MRLAAAELAGTGLLMTGVETAGAAGAVTATAEGTAAEAGAAGENAAANVLRHYKEEAGFKGIMESGMIQANARNQVFATEAAMSAEEAE